MRLPASANIRQLWGTRHFLPSLPFGASGFEEEPGAALGLVDPVFDEAGGGHVFGVVAEGVAGAQAEDEALFVFVQLAERFARVFGRVTGAPGGAPRAG